MVFIVSVLIAAAVVVVAVAVAITVMSQPSSTRARYRRHRRAIKARKHTKFNTPKGRPTRPILVCGFLETEWKRNTAKKTKIRTIYFAPCEESARTTNTSESCNTNYRVNFILVHMHSHHQPNLVWVNCMLLGTFQYVCVVFLLLLLFSTADMNACMHAYMYWTQTIAHIYEPMCQTGLCTYEGKIKYTKQRK